MNIANAVNLAKNHGSPVHFKKEATLFHEGDICNGLLLVTKGSIKVIKYSDDGKEALLYRVNENNLCILSVSCLIGAKLYNAEGIAEDDIEGVFLMQKDFSHLIDTNDNFRQFIFSNFAHRISDFIQKIDDIIFKSLKVRLKDYIEAEAKKSNDSAIHKTHQEIAVELGSSREVISRLLKALENEHFIDLSRQNIKKI
jgi:CRP/FNR family transcriptional regulator